PCRARALASRRTRESNSTDLCSSMATRTAEHARAPTPTPCEEGVNARCRARAPSAPKSPWRELGRQLEGAESRLGRSAGGEEPLGQVAGYGGGLVEKLKPAQTGHVGGRVHELEGGGQPARLFRSADEEREATARSFGGDRELREPQL